MAGVADLQVRRAGDGRIGLDQVGRIQQPAAVVALVAARRAVAAVRAGALDVAVGQEALVLDRIDHPIGAFLDVTVVLEHVGEVLGQGPVLRRGRTAEPVPAEAEAAADAVLDGVLLLAIGEDVLARFGRGQLGWRAVLVGGADVGDLVALGALEAGIDVGRQHRARQVAQVLDAVDVRQGRGDQDAGHGALGREGPPDIVGWARQGKPPGFGASARPLRPARCKRW